MDAGEAEAAGGQAGELGRSLGRGPGQIVGDPRHEQLFFHHRGGLATELFQMNLTCPPKLSQSKL